MSPPTYTVAIDLNDNGDFTDAGEAISADVLALEWRLGMAQSFDTMAAPIYARITLRNQSQAYSPEFTANPLKPGKPIRIQSNDGVTTHAHFTGFIDHIEPAAGKQGERTAVIVARGLDGDLTHNPVLIAPQVSVTADGVIQAIFNALHLRYAALNGYMIIGVDGYDIITVNKLFGPAAAPSLETGKSRLAYVGDNWTTGVPAAAAIEQVVQSEQGRFFINGAGVPTFYNRHHTLLTQTPVATFANNMEGLEYTYGMQVVNRVQVHVTPRSAGTPNSVLWQLGTPLRVDPGQVRHIIAHYRDANKLPIGALAVTAPQADVDFTANSAPDGSGTDRTADATVILTTQGVASAATLELRNNTSQTYYIQVGMQMRGTPLNRADPVTVEEDDHASMTFYGINTLTYDLSALNSVEEADQFARYTLSRRKDPQGIVRSIRISSVNLLPQVLARTLFDRVTVQDDQTNHIRDYFIIAEEHTVDLGSARHRVTWLLEPVDTDIFVIIGTHKPDGSHVIAY